MNDEDKLLDVEALKREIYDAPQKPVVMVDYEIGDELEAAMMAEDDDDV